MQWGRSQQTRRARRRKPPAPSLSRSNLISGLAIGISPGRAEKSGEQGHGTNSIRRVMDGCVVEENFSGGDSMPLRGMSLSTFDARAQKWKQTWVDNEGGYLDFVGEFRDGHMILAREAAKDRRQVLQRMVFKNISAKDLDWSWERSLDGGKTWQVVWPIHYKRKI